MKIHQPTQPASAAQMPSRQTRRAAKFAPGSALKIRIGGRVMMLVWRKRARTALLLGRLLFRSMRQLALASISGAMVLASTPSFALTTLGTIVPPLPSGASVASGRVAMSTTANVMTINQSTPQAIVNWNSFNIDSGYKVKFVQPDATSSILNRVSSGTLSSIQGQLEANGKVWLINPAGIMIGSGATINVAGFVASTLQVSDSDFLANRLKFTSGAGAGVVANDGAIATSEGGHVYLVGARVDNRGSINVNAIDPIALASGKAILAAGDTVTLTLADATLPGIKVDVTGVSGSVNNIGQIVSKAGSIGLAAAFVNNTGTLDVNQISSRDGRVFLQASNTATIGAGSAISVGAGGELLATGTVRVDGATLDLPGGTLSAAGPVFVNNATLSNLAGSVPSLVTFSGSNRLNSNISLGNVSIVPGALMSGSGKLTARNLNWSGGTIAGTSTDPSYDVFNLTMSGVPTLDGRTLNLLPGGVSTASTATLYFKNSGVLNNAGMLTVSDQTQLGYFNSPQAGNSVINNSGTIISTNTAGGVSRGYYRNYLGGARDDLNGIVFNNSGVINVLDGELHVTGGGTHTGAFNVSANGFGKRSALLFGIYNYDVLSTRNENFEAGASFSQSSLNGGVADVVLSITNNNTTNLNTDITLKNAALYAGTVQGSGKLTVTDFAWSGGTIAGRNIDPSYDITSLTLNGAETLRGRTLNLMRGGISSAFGATLSMQNQAVLNNAGTLTLSNGTKIQQGGSSGISSDINGNGVVNNSGTIIAQSQSSLFGGDIAFSDVNPFLFGTYAPITNTIGGGGSGSLNSGVVTFNNTGKVDVKSGVLNLAGTENVINRGQIHIDSGATLATSADLNNARGAQLSGSGAIALNQHTLFNDGVVAPGTSTVSGTLTINGNYTQGATGELIAKVAGTSAGQHDQLNVAGTTRLDGGLTVASLNGYVPASGGAFNLIEGAFSSSTLGKFSRLSLPSYLSVGYGLFEGAAVRLSYVGSGTTFFSNASGDLDWANATNWSGNYIPVALSDVLIDTGFTVQHAFGADSIRSLTIAAKNGLTISGGSLAVSGVSTIGGTLTVGAAGAATLSGGATGSGLLAVDGGAVRLGAATTIGNLGMTGGTLSGPANLTVTNSFRQSGGALQFAGATVNAQQASGDILVSELTATSANLVASAGAINQSAGTLTLDALTTQSARGTTLANNANRLTNVSASNSGTGDIVLASAGPLVLGSISNTGGAVAVSAAGAISQTGAIVSRALTTSSVGGTMLDGANQIGSFSANNTGSGMISLVNTTRPNALTLLAISNAGGGIDIDNTGAIITSGALNAAQGKMTITAHSPITVNSSLSARDGITLNALPSTLGTDTVSINGTLTTAAGNIAISSGTDTTISAISTLQVAPGSAILLTAVNGGVDLLAGSTFIGAVPTISQSLIRQPSSPVASPSLPASNPSVDTINSLERSVTTFKTFTDNSMLLASLDADTADGGITPGIKRTDLVDADSSTAKSGTDKSARSLPVCGK